MLSEVCRHAAEQGCAVTVVARDREKLLALVRETQMLPGVINPISIDYSDADGLKAKLFESVLHLGPIRQAVLWIKPPDSESRRKVAELLDETSAGCHLYNFMPSYTADPDRKDELPDLSYMANLNVICHQIILGFIIEGETSRWLTNDDISAGVIEAMSTGQPLPVIGTTSPWARRPKSSRG